ncbi:MAG: hypothetical protein DIU71_11200 [Proteobacteria bacterium]|nr:MAG: hypothetical protein DIU71_11200 [Pseudomonadota bacterium]
MYITRKHLPRRTFLRGVGASIALPLLDAMIPAATALAHTAARPQPRMGFVYFPHGAVMSHWTPTTTGRDFEVPRILAPLAKFREHMTIVSGLRNRPAESNTPHAIIAGTWLGCVAPAVSHEPKAGTTCDQIAARHIGMDTPFPSIELATESGTVCDPAYGCSYGNTISFRSPTQPLPMENNPRKMFYRLFGQGDTAEERAAIADENMSILDSIADSAKSLERELGAADRTVVRNYLDSVREIERRVQKMQGEALADIEIPDAPVGIPQDFEEHLKIMFELIALAFQANLTRVASFMMAREVSMRTYTNLGISEAFHPLSHHQNNADKLERLVRVQTFHSEVFAGFIERLANIQDGDGSLLDHSIIVYGSNMSDSDLHNNDPLPMSVFGRACGRIKGNQHLAYPQDTPLANLLVTVLDRAGVPVERLGDSTGQFAEV